MCLWEILPYKLQHQQLVEVCIQQGSGNRVQLPVVIVCASGNVDNHYAITLLDSPTGPEEPSVSGGPRLSGLEVEFSADISGCFKSVGFNRGACKDLILLI